MDRTTHRRAYDKWLQKRCDSKQRGIAFNLTFDEWYNWWLSNGVDKNIDSRHDVCMCRNNDLGAYEIGNIYFATRIQNAKDARKWNPILQQGKLNHNYGNTGGLNPLSKKVKTPIGVFDSLKEAAMAYNITSEGMRGRLRRRSNEYFYA